MNEYRVRAGQPRDIDAPTMFASDASLIEWIARDAGVPIAEVRTARAAAAERRAAHPEQAPARAKAAARLAAAPRPTPPISDPDAQRAGRMTGPLDV